MSDIFRRVWTGVEHSFRFFRLTPLSLVRTDNVNGSLAVTYGPLHLPFGVYFVTCLISALYLLNQKRKRLTGTDRAHTQYLLIAVLSAAIGATVTNLILPLIRGTSRYGEYGPLFTLLLVGLIGHAILRHRLMNIRFVIRRGVVYLTAFVASGLASLVFIAALAFLFPGEHYCLHRQRIHRIDRCRCCFIRSRQRFRSSVSAIFIVNPTTTNKLFATRVVCLGEL